MARLEQASLTALLASASWKVETFCDLAEEGYEERISQVR